MSSLENNAPDDDRAQRFIDLRLNHKPSSTMSKRRSLMPTHRHNSKFDNGLFSPPSSQTMEIAFIDASKSLISPPPEEILRQNSRRHLSANSTNVQLPCTPSLFASPSPPSEISFVSKRKRAGVVVSSPTPHVLGNDAFSRRGSINILDQSPGHVPETTPNPKPRKQFKPHTRDLMPPPSTRRSVTPLLVYEPPREQFTPPREILGTPISSRPSKVVRSSRRKSMPKQKVMKVVIKNEPPDVDLTLPLPPPSPTDDPLLLSAPPLKSVPRDFEDFFVTLTDNVSSDEGDSCGISDYLTATPEPLNDEEELLGPLADNRRDSFNTRLTISESLNKQDKFSGILANACDNGHLFATLEPHNHQDEAPLASDCHDSINDFTTTKPLNDQDEFLGPHANGCHDNISVLSATSEPRHDRDESLGPIADDCDNSFSNPAITYEPRNHQDEFLGALANECHDNISVPSTTSEPCHDKDESLGPIADDCDNSFTNTITTYEPRSHQDEFLGPLANDCDGSATSHFPIIPEPRNSQDEPLAPLADNFDVATDNSDIPSDEDETDSNIDVSMVRITSDDPSAAVRVAAILNQYDYDCFARISDKRRRHPHLTPDTLSRNTRRKSVFASGITKATSPLKERRTTMGGDVLFIPGSPAMTLHGLGGVPKVSEREWTKDDWKQLDACFTDERLDVGTRLGLEDGALSEVDEVQIENVVNRFLSVMDGAGIANVSTPEWTKESLSIRVQALQKKQRSGSVAPSALNSPGSPIMCPDFTPLVRQPPPPILQLTSPPPHPPPSISKRMKGFLFSYLPTMSKPSLSARRSQPSCALPLPPPEMIGKLRGPISTPVRPVISKPVHPKDLVRLQPAPIPKVSMIPRVSKPRRLVELRPSAPLASSAQPIPIPRRRSSGGSVKDLVQSFEEMQDRQALKKLDLKRIRSTGDRSQQESRPTWRY